MRSLLGLSLVAGSSWGAQARAEEDGVVAYMQTAQFKIPFNVEARTEEATQVQLWVSADGGETWQAHGKVGSDAKFFEFRAAAEGYYLFKVVTIDASGATFPGTGPALKVLVDTTKPQAEIRADINADGKLAVDVRVVDEFLDINSASLRIRSDHETQWRELPLSFLPNGPLFEGQATTDLAPCREIAVVFTVKDRSSNEGEATFHYSVPRTASADSEMTLASSRQSKEADTAKPAAPVAKPSNWPAGGAVIPGATRWSPTAVLQPPHASQAPLGVAASVASPGKFVAQSTLTLDAPAPSFEELPLPPADRPEHPVATENQSLADQQGLELTLPAESAAINSRTGNASVEDPGKAGPASAESGMSAANVTDATTESSTIGRAFHCKSRAFSLDYSVQALGGSTLAEVELWGTEDGGRAWQKWGSDPDRVSPFDVQVGNDGMFGFRMVIIGANGVVSNRPHAGDSADVWINIDTNLPTIKITRAVYGEGPEDGLLVIDYNCEDGHLVDRPIAIFFSERIDGPWTPIASGLANTGIYLWKADPSLPDKVFLKIEAVDKAGNIGVHRLELPIDIRGLAPRGVIQGFRPIELPSN